MSDDTRKGTGMGIALRQVDGCCGDPVGVAPAQVQAEVKVLAALADVTRLQIVQMLARQDEPLCVCDIVPRFTLGQPTISHHLKVLRDAGLVTCEKRGLWVYYMLDRAALAGINGYLDTLLSRSSVGSGAPPR